MIEYLLWARISVVLFEKQSSWKVYYNKNRIGWQNQELKRDRNINLIWLLIRVPVCKLNIEIVLYILSVYIYIFFVIWNLTTKYELFKNLLFFFFTEKKASVNRHPLCTFSGNKKPLCCSFCVLWKSRRPAEDKVSDENLQVTEKNSKMKW